MLRLAQMAGSLVAQYFIAWRCCQLVTCVFQGSLKGAQQELVIPYKCKDSMPDAVLLIAVLAAATFAL
jgi:hypothetical protein